MQQRSVRVCSRQSSSSIHGCVRAETEGVGGVQRPRAPVRRQTAGMPWQNDAPKPVPRAGRHEKEIQGTCSRRQEG